MNNFDDIAVDRNGVTIHTDTPHRLSPRELLDALKKFEETEKHEDLPKISVDNLAEFLAQMESLCEEPYLGVYAEHWFADVAMLAFINDERVTERFIKLCRYYE